MSVCMDVCSYVYSLSDFSISLYLCISIYLFYRSILLSIYVSIYHLLSFYLSIYVSIYLSTIYRSIYLSTIYLSMYLSIFLCRSYGLTHNTYMLIHEAMPLGAHSLKFLQILCMCLCVYVCVYLCVRIVYVCLVCVYVSLGMINGNRNLDIEIHRSIGI